VSCLHTSDTLWLRRQQHALSRLPDSQLSLKQKILIFKGHEKTSKCKKGLITWDFSLKLLKVKQYIDIEKLYLATPLWFRPLPPLAGWVPLERLPQNFYRHVTDGQGTKWRRNIAKNFNSLSRVHQRCRRQTTDKQTDGRTTIYSERHVR